MGPVNQSKSVPTPKLQINKCAIPGLVQTLKVHICSVVNPSFQNQSIVGDMGWLRFVGSLKLQVSFVKEPCKRDDILQKRPIIQVLRSLLIVAIPYECLFTHMSLRSRLTCCKSQGQFEIQNIPIQDVCHSQERSDLKSQFLDFKTCLDFQEHPTNPEKSSESYLILRGLL